MNILCTLGFHDESEILLNLRTDRRVRVCRRCKKVVAKEIPNHCGCGKCIAYDLNWNNKLIKLGKVIEV